MLLLGYLTKQREKQSEKGSCFKPICTSHAATAERLSINL